MREFLEIFFRGEGYDVDHRGDVDAALLALDADDFDVVITRHPDAGRQRPRAAPRSVKEAAPETVVIMITAFATTETAIAAMKQGAYDYITKPFKVDELRLVVEKALEKKLARGREPAPAQRAAQRRGARQLVGNERARCSACYELIAQVATTKTNVLI